MRRGLTFVLLAGVLALLPSANASAATAQHRSVEIKGSLGLGRDQVEIWSDARTNLQLSVSRANRRAVQSAEYVAKDAGLRGSNRLEGELGNLGSISMRFHATQVHRVKSPSCLVRIHARGYLKGLIEFEAENGFVQFGQHRMKAKKTVLTRRAGCHPKTRQRGLEPIGNPTLLAACSDGGGFFLASRDKSVSADSSFFAVAPPVRHSGLILGAFLAVVAPADAFRPAPDLTSAAIEPPPPFSGSATYSSADRLITGDLSWTTLSGRSVTTTPAPAKMRKGNTIGCPGQDGFGVAGSSAEQQAEAALRQLQRDYAPAPAGSAAG